MDRWFFPIQRMEQRDDHGCAIACVAMVCGISYERAKQEFFPRERAETLADDKRLMMNGEQMMRVIRKLGYSCVARSGFKEHKLPSIVVFDWKTPNSGTHAVVWDPFRECFLDPGYDWPLSSKRYMQNWRRSNYASVIVTGKKKR